MTITPDEWLIQREILSAGDTLRRFSLVQRCMILAATCAVHELPCLAKLVADAAQAQADATKGEL
jgi:hypothetical protein